jgi:hypothetical protein
VPDLTVDIPTPYGVVTLPLAQAVAVVECVNRLAAEGQPVTWHRNECGCCVTVHADTRPLRGGYVIGRDGGTDWLDLDDHEH